MRNVKQDLANLSQQSVGDIRMSKLMKFADAAQKHRELEATYNNDLNLNIPHMEKVRNTVAKILEAQADEVNGDLPVISVFDAYQHVKGQKDLQKDAGLRALGGHLQKMWDNALDERGPSEITAASYMKLKDHYARNYPKSRVAKVIEGFGKKGYATLDRRDLVRLASSIQTQEDFEQIVIENGLQGRAPNQVKARKFLLACVNSQEENCCPFDRTAQGVPGRDNVFSGIAHAGGEFVKDEAPEDWAERVYTWLIENNPGAISDDQGSFYVDSEDIKDALSALGWLIDEDEIDWDEEQGNYPYDVKDPGWGKGRWEKLVDQYTERADAEREAGGSIEINYNIPYVAVTLSDGEEYFFQEDEADDLMNDIPEEMRDLIDPEDYILATAQNW